MELTKQARRTLLICVVLSAVTLGVFWPVTGHDFISCDDPAFVTLNAHVLKGLNWANVGWAFSTTFYDYYHPLAWLSHMTDVELFGMKPGWHHLTSLLLHVANTLLLFQVLRRMTGAVWRSAFVAALFALHPLHVESVAWVAERKDVLSAFFFMLTLLAYTRYAEVQRPTSSVRSQEAGDGTQNAKSGFTGHGSRITDHASRYYLLSLLFFALGLMSKPMLVTVPFVLLLLDYWPLQRCQPAPCNLKPSARKFHPSSFILHPLLLEKLPFLALSAATCVGTILTQSKVGVVSSLAMLSLTQRVSNMLVNYATYLIQAFWPVGLALFYPLRQWPLEVVVAAGVALLGITAWVVWCARRSPYLAVGWFWFLGMLMPVIGLVQSGAQQMADRYTYLPLIGVFIVLVWGAAELFSPLVGRAVPSGPSASAETDNAGAITYSPGALRAARPTLKGRVVCGIAASAVLLACAALTSRQVYWWQDTERLFQHALDVTRDNYIAHNNLAGDYLLRGKLDEAIEHYQASLAMQPLQTYQLEIHYYLGDALSKRGRYAEAAEQFSEVLSEHPDSVPALVQLGSARARQGKPDEAVQALSEALRIQPDDAGAHNSLGNVLAQQGKHVEAVRQFEEAVRLKPDHAGAHNNLALSLSKLGRVGDAITHYREAIRLQPDSLGAVNNLAWLLAACPEAQFRNGTEAVELSTRACELTKYLNPTTLATLAAAYGESGKLREAISFAEQAQALTAGSNSAAATRLRLMLEAFHAGQAYHDD